MNRFKMVDLRSYYNHSGIVAGNDASIPVCFSLAKEIWQEMPVGLRRFHGIPFRLSKPSGTGSRIIALSKKERGTHVPLRGKANYLLILHFCDVESSKKNVSTGDVLAQYAIFFPDATECSIPIRKRFEIDGWGTPTRATRRGGNFASVHYAATTILTEAERAPYGSREVGVKREFLSRFAAYVYALRNPKPQTALTGIEFAWKARVPVGILGLTLYSGPGHPLRLERRNVFRVSLPSTEKTRPEEVDCEADMGQVTGIRPIKRTVLRQKWFNDGSAGLGMETKPRPRSTFLVEAAAALGAKMRIRAGENKPHEFVMDEVYTSHVARSTDGLARIQLLHPQKNWLSVRIIDESTGEPTPCRVHFSGASGEYLPPHGHQSAVNVNWFEDYGGDLKLGEMSYAYVPGEFQIELPYGKVYGEISKGFEYEPIRREIRIVKGMRQLEITIPRKINLRDDGWITADTHVHFVSPQTAWLEGQAEGLNLVNLLATQLGKMFTNVADITGEVSGCSKNDTIVWVGTENRHHMLGHLSMLGTKGSPIFPMCGGGPNEAYIGDPEFCLLTEWAKRCRDQEGVVIRPHFPGPLCEDPTYIVNGLIDAAEIRQCGDPDKGPQSSDGLAEWYRYLNCGYRVAVAGGTDKMSAATPVGGSRTYAKLRQGEVFSFDSWARAMRDGRSFVTNGPILTLSVEGKQIGEEISLPEGGGTLEAEAAAQCVWPIHMLEIIVNGKVVDHTRSDAGISSLRLKCRLAVRDSCWIAARCASRLRKHQSMMGAGYLGAHTSPVYVTVAHKRPFSTSDALYMLTLLEGTITYLDVLGTRLNEQRHREMISVVDDARHHLLHKMGRC